MVGVTLANSERREGVVCEHQVPVVQCLAEAEAAVAEW